MKKLNKLLINSERLMKNKELMTLRGGLESGPVKFLCNCNGLPPNAWWGCYSSADAIAQAIYSKCGGMGGGCSAAGPCE